MKRFTDFLVNSPAAILTVLGSFTVVVFGVVTAVIFPGTAAVAIGLIIAAAGLLALLGVLGISTDWARTQVRIDRLNADVAEARRSANSVYYAAEIPEDTEPDTPAANKLLRTFSPSTPLMENLRINRGQDLPKAGAKELTEFLNAFRKQSFADPKVHTAFMDVFRTAEALDAWINNETSQDGDILTVTPGDTREGGWREFSAATARAEELSQQLQAARAAFERAALEAELL